jgi:hypothetical protein
MSDLIEKELYIEEYIGKIYKKFKLYKNIKQEKLFRKLLKSENINEDINPYHLYSLKILDLLDEEFKLTVPFDQHYGFSSSKSSHTDGNLYIKTNEIYAVANELPIRLKNNKITENIISRVRVLATVNDWCKLLDFDTYQVEHSDKFFPEVKMYLQGNKKYMRYARLIKAAIVDAKYFEHPDVLPSTEEKFMEFIMSPFIYVMLQPYNYLLNSEIDENLSRILELIDETGEIMKGVIIDGEVEF